MRILARSAARGRERSGAASSSKIRWASYRRDQLTPRFENENERAHIHFHPSLVVWTAEEAPHHAAPARPVSEAADLS